MDNLRRTYVFVVFIILLLTLLTVSIAQAPDATITWVKNNGDACVNACNANKMTPYRVGRDDFAGGQKYTICLARDDLRPGFGRGNVCYFTAGGGEQSTKEFQCMCMK